MTTTTQSQSAKAGNARVFTILGFVFGAVAVLILPILFGPAAIIMAAIGMRKGDPLAKWALAVAIVGTIVGFALGAAVMSSNDDALRHTGR